MKDQCPKRPSSLRKDETESSREVGEPHRPAFRNREPRSGRVCERVLILMSSRGQNIAHPLFRENFTKLRTPSSEARPPARRRGRAAFCNWAPGQPPAPPHTRAQPWVPVNGSFSGASRERSQAPATDHGVEAGTQCPLGPLASFTESRRQATPRPVQQQSLRGPGHQHFKALLRSFQHGTKVTSSTSNSSHDEKHKSTFCSKNLEDTLEINAHQHISHTLSLKARTE